jgi:hypothetical protein
MADFKTHITASTVAGVGYGVAGFWLWNLPAELAILAGGMCSVAGMLPDVDSDSGQTVREITGFAAAIVPWLLLERLRSWNLSNESLVLASGGLYLLVRFGVSQLLQRITVHRGMWHSIPAALTAGLVASLINEAEPSIVRLFKGGGVALGYLVHLMFDELYSLQWRRGRIRIKKSFGSALKLWGDSAWATTSAYANLALCAALAFYPPSAVSTPPAAAQREPWPWTAADPAAEPAGDTAFDPAAHPYR